MKECMDLSRIHLAVQNQLGIFLGQKSTYSKEIIVFYFYFICLVAKNWALYYKIKYVNKKNLLLK
jgi:hypothetical protein